MYKKFIAWWYTFSTNQLQQLTKDYQKLVDTTLELVVNLVTNTPEDVLNKFIKTQHWLTEWQLLTNITTEELFYQETDAGKILSVSLKDVPYQQLKSILDSFSLFIAEKVPSIKVHVTDIIWDTNNENIELSNNMYLMVPTNLKGIDLLNYISDEISNVSSWTHKGYSLECDKNNNI